MPHTGNADRLTHTFIFYGGNALPDLEELAKTKSAVIDFEARMGSTSGGARSNSRSTRGHGPDSR